MGIFENPAGIFFSAGKLKIPAGMPTLADIFSSTVKYFMKSYRNYSECSIVMCSSGFKKFGAEKRHVEFAKNRCGKKKPVAVPNQYRLFKYACILVNTLNRVPV